MDKEEIKKLLLRAGQYTAKYEKSAKEVADKLRQWTKSAISVEEIDYIVKELKAEHFIDEERYIQRYISDKLNTLHKGPMLIRYELLERGLPEKLVQKELNAIPHDQWAEALETYLKPKAPKLGAKAKSDEHLRYLLQEVAYRRGFPTDSFSGLLEKVSRELEQNDFE